MEVAERRMKCCVYQGQWNENENTKTFTEFQKAKLN